MSLKAIIVDDERHSRETLKTLLGEFCEDVAIVGSIGSVEEAIVAISTTNPDVVFLDVELQSGTGFDILTQIKPINFEIIFITAFEQYAIKAVKYSSLDYLLKPIDLDELKEAVEKVKKKKKQEIYNKQLEVLIYNLRKQPKLHKICLSTSDGLEFIALENIIYCKANGSYTSFFLKNKGSVLVSKHLKEYENLLADLHFMRVHNSFLINLKEVEKYMKSEGGYILMSNRDTVSISKSKKEAFLNAMSHL